MFRDGLMQRHRWLATILVLLFVAGSGQFALGQPMPPGPGGMSGPGAMAPGAMGMPSPYGPQTGGPWYQPPTGQGSYPNYYQPWPAVSPYAIDQSDLSNENGLWMNDLIPRGQNKKLNLRLDYIRALVSTPNGLVGNPDAPSYKRFIEPLFANQQGGGGGGGQNQQSPLDPFLGTATTPGFNLFDPVNANVVGEPRMKGLRLTLDSTNADGSGLTVTGFWAEDNDASFNARDEVHPSRGTERYLLTNFVLDPTFDPTDPADLAKIAPFTVDEILENNLLNLRGIPLDDGSLRRNPDGTVTGGIAAPYDLEFRLNFTVQQYGTGLSWSGAPIYRTKYIRVNPNYGMRYHALREHFGFLGMDSGVFYGSTGGGGGGNNNISGDLKLHSIPDGTDGDGDGIFDNAGGGDDQQQGGGGGGGGAGMSSFVTTNDFLNIYPVTSILRNSVYSNMVGPEVGLNYTIAGERIRVGGKSNFSLLGNFEKIRLSGDNIFPTTRQTNSLLPTPENGRPNQFEESEDHAHVSPMFEQSLYVEGPVLEYIPLVRRVTFLKNANFRLGYTLTVIGEVTRPNNAILWTANPAIGGFPQDPSTGLYPRIQTPERETWKSTAWDFGLSWTW